jgi:hypothetical protein
MAWIHAALQRLTGGVEGVERRVGGLGPIVRPVEGHLPFVQGFALGKVHRFALAYALNGLQGLRRGGGQCGVEVLQRRRDLRVVLVVDRVDVGVVCDGFERDMRHGFIVEAAAETLMRIAERVIVEAGGHQPLLGQRDRHARGVAGDPAPPPFLGDEGGGAGAAGRIEHQIAGIGGHQHAAFNNLHGRLDDIHLFFREAAGTHIRPNVPNLRCRKIINETDVGK